MDYPLEQLDPERFQKVCQALLLPEFPKARFFAIGQEDGGRDAVSQFRYRTKRDQNLIVFQVKFLRDPSTLPNPQARRKWVAAALASERSNIEALAAEGATHYRLITNVRGSGGRSHGSIDQLQKSLNTLPIPADAWWRDDLITRLDVAWDVKWRYPELLTGPDLLRALLIRASDAETDRRSAAIHAFLEQERLGDDMVKFRQVGLENSLLDLFVDLPLSPTKLDRRLDYKIAHALSIVANESGDPVQRDYAALAGLSDIDQLSAWTQHVTAPAAAFLLHTDAAHVAPRLVIEGAPGQGKSTVSQFVCQVHRCRLLESEDLDRIAPHFKAGALRLPFRIDLRDLAAWLHGRNPFGTEDEGSLPRRRTLETFLATQIEISSGGATFSVSDLQAIARESSLLLALDGLDEVADIGERDRVVSEATAAISRLRRIALSLQVIVTSRPAAFENSPGFSRKDFAYLELTALTETSLTDYSEKWMAARRLDPRSAKDVRRVIGEKLNAPHMKDLAKNPMQLAILLSLVHQRGPSLPDKRTALYDSYVDLFFDREAEKTSNVAQHRDLLMEIHQYLGWRLQAEAETGNTQGAITDEGLRGLLRAYLSHEEKDSLLIDELFTALVERVVAIVSRVQGTYEFEVQPLREYFAARFLYDTAHHSSPGNERQGDKTDRFDAIARNFYWLNVTRFFAGCFSKGELLSLVERLEVLAEEDGLRQTDHPRRLASMLLGDWVFAQNPRSMKAVVDIVLRDVATRADSARSSDVIVLPEGSGRAEVVDRCWELWEGDFMSDRSLVVAQTLQANADPRDLDKRWTQRVEATTGDDRTKWLQRGLWIGSLARASASELESLCDDDKGLWDEERFSLFLRAGHADLYETGHDIASFAVSTILDHRTFIGRSDKPARTALEALAQAVSALCSPRDAFRLRPIRNATPLKQLDSDLPILAPFREVWAAAQQLASQRREWQTLAPWTHVVELIRESWGEVSAAIDIAVNAAGVRDSGSRGSVGDGLFDSTHPLAERARYARLRAGAGEWWSTQLDATGDDFDEQLIASLFFAWAGKSTVRASIRRFDLWMRQQSPADREAVNRRVVSVVGTPGSGRSQHLLDLQLLNLDLHPTTVLVMGNRGRFRTSDELPRVLYGHYGADFNNPSIDPIVRYFAARGALEVAMDDRAKWPEALAAVRDGYTSGLQAGRHLQYETQREEIPLELARDVVENWRDYPLAIVSLAEQTCRRDMGQRVETLQSVAGRQEWEWI